MAVFLLQLKPISTLYLEMKTEISA